MASSYDLPHFRVEQFKVDRPYKRRDKDLSNAGKTIKEGHGNRLREKLSLRLLRPGAGRMVTSQKVSASPPKLRT